MNLNSVVPPLLTALTRLQSAQRHLHPIHLEQVKGKIDDVRRPLQDAYVTLTETEELIAAGVRTSVELA